MIDALRLYAPEELAADGYPPEWHKLECTLCQGLGRCDAVWLGSDNKPVEIDCPACHGSGDLPIKKMVRAMAEHRCVRCLHPYQEGTGEWSPCDKQCVHTDECRGQMYPGVANPPPPRPIRFTQGALTETAGAWALRMPVEARWRILTVHHLDGNKANCRWWNLAALCQRCHLQIQGKVKMERVWPWEHTDWFKPYVAGYYAHVYLGEDLNPIIVAERLDELLALERMA